MEEEKEENVEEGKYSKEGKGDTFAGSDLIFKYPEIEIFAHLSLPWSIG